MLLKRVKVCIGDSDQLLPHGLHSFEQRRNLHLLRLYLQLQSFNVLVSAIHLHPQVFDHAALFLHFELVKLLFVRLF